MNLLKLLWNSLVMSYLTVASEKDLFSNSWAVEVNGGLNVADNVARKYGFTNKGQVCS